MQKLKPLQRGDTISKALIERAREKGRKAGARNRGRRPVGSRRRPPDPDVSCVRWCSQPAVNSSVHRTGLERKEGCMHACNGHVYIYGNGLPLWASLDMHGCMHACILF
jgi:hypothetical protein